MFSKGKSLILSKFHFIRFSMYPSVELIILYINFRKWCTKWCTWGLWKARKPLILLGFYYFSWRIVGTHWKNSHFAFVIIRDNHFGLLKCFLNIRDAPWWYRIDVSSLWQTTFPTSIMDNYKRFALSKKNTDKMLHKHYKFFIADFQSKFYLFTKSICHNL